MPVPMPVISPLSTVPPIVASGVFVGLMSLFKEPVRQKLSALIIAGAGFVYFGSSFHGWEVVFGALFLWLAYRSLTNYTFVGIGWMVHVFWDVVHHLYGQPILPYVPLSSFGCALCDTGIAIWYFVGAPSIWSLALRRTESHAHNRFNS